MNNKILLVGNGINLVSDKSVSWNDLLNRIAGTASTTHEEDIRNAKPFTLWFEEIIRKSGSSNIKNQISSYLDNYLVSNKYHSQLMDLGFDNILTTNYDYNLENSQPDEWHTNQSAKETYYSLFRKNSCGQQNVWHIHGELKNSNSIMLGHDQYSGYLHKIRSFLTTGVPTEVKERKGQPYRSKFSGKKMKGKTDVISWVDLFLENEVHIVGFSFDYTENHLWNLLMYKEKLRKKGKSIGVVNYHRCSTNKQNINDEAKLSILTSLGTNIHDHVATTYEKSYSKCINYLKMK